jgi:hypothetical protein
VSGKLPVRILVHVKASEDVTLTRPLNSLLVKHLREPRRGQRKRMRKRLRLIEKTPQPISKPKDLPPRLCYNCRQPGHFSNECPNPRQQKPQQQKQNPGSAINNNKPSPQVEQSQLNFLVTPLSQNHSSPPLVISNLGTRFFLRGVDCDAPGF